MAKQFGRTASATIGTLGGAWLLLESTNAVLSLSQGQTKVTVI
jgi:hypothetical protein